MAITGKHLPTTRSHTRSRSSRACRSRRGFIPPLLPARRGESAAGSAQPRRLLHNRCGPVTGRSSLRTRLVRGGTSATRKDEIQLKPATRTIDIIIPVYRGYELTRRCIGSVLAGRLRSESHVVLIDDASPEAAIRAYLDEIGADERVTLIRNTRNLGFVASVNRGMQVHPDRDVVLLNSDTEVANDWLDRLRDCVYSEDHIATATPFSNNATICSYPLFCRDNPMPHGLDVAALDRVFRDTNRGRRVELPTAVGSCMFIRRPALDAAGLFDEAAFGRGYGEEADFCCRASALGWRHMLCADTFVFHAGGASFGPDKLALSEAAQAVIRARHPDYQQKVDRHLMLDPAADLRRAVELEIESRRRRGLEMPIAARWRVPRVRSSLVLSVSGRNTPASHMRASRITSAPSCIGFS